MDEALLWEPGSTAFWLDPDRWHGVPFGEDGRLEPFWLHLDKRPSPLMRQVFTIVDSDGAANRRGLVNSSASLGPQPHSDYERLVRFRVSTTNAPGGTLPVMVRFCDRVYVITRNEIVEAPYGVYLCLRALGQPLSRLADTVGNMMPVYRLDDTNRLYLVGWRPRPIRRFRWNPTDMVVERTAGY